MEEEESIISFEPEKEKNNDNLDKTMNLDIYKEDYGEFPDEFSEDDEELMKLLNNDNKKDIEKENKNLAKLQKENDISNIQQNKNKIKYKNKNKVNKLKFSESKLSKKLKLFFLNVYNIIYEDNYDKIESDDDENEKEIKYLLDLIKEILSEDKNSNCEISFVFGNKEKTFTDREFIINLYILHKIKKCNNLLNITIIFKVKIEMAIRSGNAKINISKLSIDYQDKKQEIVMKPNFNCLIINNKLGNYSITYCTCGDCMNCKNRKEPKPFDDILLYLRNKNNISKKVDFTGLWFGKYNRYRNESGYKCSFCTDFYQKKLNIVKLFCNPDFDSDHRCQFWICRDCYQNKKRIKRNELCPNCQKFIINFWQLNRIYRYLKWKKHRNTLLDV